MRAPAIRQGSYRGQPGFKVGGVFTRTREGAEVVRPAVALLAQEYVPFDLQTEWEAARAILGPILWPGLTLLQGWGRTRDRELRADAHAVIDSVLRSGY